MSKSLRVACLQMSSGKDVDSNLTSVVEHLEGAEQTDLIVLPENFAQMPASRADQYVEVDGEGIVQATLAELARKYQTCIVAGSLAVLEAQNDKPFARSLVFDKFGERVAHYDKVHLFDIDVPDSENSRDHRSHQRYRESATYAHGDLAGVQAVDLAAIDLKIGLTICYDLRFAEQYRALAAQGAQLVTVPSAFTYETGQAHWRTLLSARAIENQVFILAAAQTGEHANGRRTWGHSMIIDPWGRIVAEQRQGEGLLIAEIDLTDIQRLKQIFPMHEHRRL